MPFSFSGIFSQVVLQVDRPRTRGGGAKEKEVAALHFVSSPYWSGHHLRKRSLPPPSHTHTHTHTQRANPNNTDLLEIRVVVVGLKKTIGPRSAAYGGGWQEERLWSMSARRACTDIRRCCPPLGTGAKEATPTYVEFWKNLLVSKMLNLVAKLDGRDDAVAVRVHAPHKLGL